VSFGPSGIEVGASEPPEIQRRASSERITAGFQDLDALLGGGVFRSTSTLISGVPGTAKTTLAGKFAEAACRRGERTLFISYDEGAEQIARNLSSVGIRLRPHLKSGHLRMYSARPEGISAEQHLLKLRSLIHEYRPQCLVIDPLTAIAKAGSLDAARAVASRFISMVKDEDITLLVTALSQTDDPRSESTDLQVSTIADTWIHLSYRVSSGERNRALTIIKSRGTAHSNQVRELVLGASGPILTGVYSAGGEVLMGTLRWEKEAEDSARKVRQRAEFEQERRELQLAAAKTGAAIKALQSDLQRQRAALASHSEDHEARNVSASKRTNELRIKRGGSSADSASKKAGKGRRR
jgi:circadian clock protein KaiC